MRGMPGRKLKRNSIMYKMAVTVMAVLLLQSLLLLGALALGGTVYQLNRNALDILNERTINRKNYLENEMVSRWSKLGSTEQELQSLTASITAQFKVSAVKLASNNRAANRFLENAAEPLIQLLRRQSVTGTFLVLGADGGEHNPGLYFRDFDPKSNPGDYSDLLMERGPSQIGKNLGVPLDARWEATFTLAGEPAEGMSYDFYTKPLEAAVQYPGENYENLGYWSRSFHLPMDTTDIITYSVPLLGDDGRAYGVLGVEISLPYLNTLLPYQEIGAEHNSAYLLGIGHDNVQSYEPVALNGPLFKRILTEKKEFAFQKEGSVKNVYLMEAQSGVEASYGSVQYLKLYNSNTPFVGDQWVLVGLDVRSSLLSFTYKMLLLLAIAWAVSLVVGMVFAYVASRFVTNPVRSLVDKVLRSNPNEPVLFEKTHISEVDDLAASIEVLSQRVAASASKLSRIIQMASVPIGAFEYDFNGDTVNCTDHFFDILSDSSVPRPENEHCVSKQVFEGYIQRIARNQEPGGTESAVVFRLNDGRGYHKWVRLKLVTEQTKRLGVVEDITAEVQEKKKIEYERDYDLLTNLLNRRAFQSSMQALWERPEQLRVGALVMLDLDNLKYINDTFGHDYGDQYIRCTAHILTGHVPQPALLSRMSGDEFYIFYYGYDSKQAIRRQLKLLQDGFQEKVFRLPGEEGVVRVRASAGVAWYPEDSTTMNDLIRYADFAMYTVKKTVKGAFQEFDKEAYLRDSYLLEERENINRFIEEELVEYYFQPIVSAKDGSVLGYEALMRPQMQGLKSPMDILALARSQSKLYQIEKLTLFHAMKAFRDQKNLPDGCRVFINSVANQCLDDADLREFERAFPELLGRMVVELTEEEKLNNSCLGLKRACAKRWGCQFALDDFGEGYNGEGILLKLNPDFVKIDRSLVQGVDEDQDRQQLVQNLVAYARRRGILVVAEGVETPQELNKLILLGVDYLQGFYIGMPESDAKPVPNAVCEEIRRAAQHRSDRERPSL